MRWLPFIWWLVIRGRWVAALLDDESDAVNSNGSYAVQRLHCVSVAGAGIDFEVNLRFSALDEAITDLIFELRCLDSIVVEKHASVAANGYENRVFPIGVDLLDRMISLGKID